MTTRDETLEVRLRVRLREGLRGRVATTGSPAMSALPGRAEPGARRLTTAESVLMQMLTMQAIILDAEDLLPEGPTSLAGQSIREVFEALARTAADQDQAHKHNQLRARRAGFGAAVFGAIEDFLDARELAVQLNAFERATAALAGFNETIEEYKQWRRLH